MGALISPASRAGPRVLALWLLLAALLPARTWAQEVVEYYGTDALGSIRVVYTPDGNLLGCADYLPYGEELPCEPPVQTPERFTGQARDGEAGLDYFHARMYQPRTGRFNGVDPVYVGPADPQQWNRYAYARNSPLMFVDPTGLTATAQTGCSQAKGAYWCPGTLFIPDAHYVPSDNPLDWGYHGEELTAAEANWDRIARGADTASEAVPLAIPFIVGAADALAKAAAATLITLGLFEVAQEILSEDVQPWRPFPGWDPTQSPGEDWVWKGRGSPGSQDGNWVNPKTDEWLHPDFRAPAAHPSALGLAGPKRRSLEDLP